MEENNSIINDNLKQSGLPSQNANAAEVDSDGGGNDNDSTSKHGSYSNEDGETSITRTTDRDRTSGSGQQHHPVAEFLYQLTKMLTDDNSEIIEWCDGRIKVHYPERLEGEVLHKYFRHSKCEF